MVVILLLISQLLFLSNIDRLQIKTAMDTNLWHLFIACNLLIVFLMITAELWARYSKQSLNMGWLAAGF